jgi:hypothetical protein
MRSVNVIWALRIPKPVGLRKDIAVGGDRRSSRYPGGRRRSPEPHPRLWSGHRRGAVQFRVSNNLILCRRPTGACFLLAFVSGMFASCRFRVDRPRRQYVERDNAVRYF